MKRIFTGIVLVLLLTGMLTLAFNIQPVKAEGTIYIRPDGSIDPPTPLITTADNVTYTFTGNISDSIYVERDNIVVDGAGHSVTGSGWEIGIDIDDQSNVTVENMTIKNWAAGIVLYSSSNNTLSGNNIANNWRGIWLSTSSNNNVLSGNNVTANSEYGIGLYVSSNNMLRNNHMSDNQYNLDFSGFEFPYLIQDIDSSNTVDRKPVYYWVNQQNRIVPFDAGYVALVNSTNITAQNLNLKNNFQGLLLAYTNNSSIESNNITNNAYGIHVAGSFNNTIAQNDITNNEYYGIYLDRSTNNTIAENIVINNYDGICLVESSDDNSLYGNSLTDNADSGIYLVRSYNSSIVANNITDNNMGIYLLQLHSILIVENNVTNNNCGVYLEQSSNNRIFHNDFVNNNKHAHFSTSGYANTWDNGVEGNYWSDYSGTDANHDGIGDTAYVIDANNTDNYPLMVPTVIPEFSSSLILPLFSIATLLGVIVYRRKRR